MSDKYKYDAASTSCDPLVKFEKSIKDFDENWALYEELTKTRETIKKMAEALRSAKGSLSPINNYAYKEVCNALELAKPWLEGK